MCKDERKDGLDNIVFNVLDQGRIQQQKRIKKMLKQMTNKINIETKSCLGSMSVGDLFVKNAYIPPKMRALHNTANSFEESLETEKIAILGAAGSGKSLLLFSRFLKMAAEYEKNPFNTKIPIFIPCKSIERADVSLSEAINRIFNCSIGVEDLEGAELYIFLDGIDEISFHFSSFINELIKRSSFITCRDSVKDNFKEFFSEKVCFLIQTWSDDQIKEFVSRYMNLQPSFRCADINDIEGFIINNRTVFSTPLMVSLLLYAIDAIELNEINELDIFELSLRKFGEREIINKNRIPNRLCAMEYKEDFLQKVLETGCWVYRCNRGMSLKELCEKTCELIQIDKRRGVIEKILSLIFVQTGFENSRVSLRIHEKIGDFLFARKCYHIISQNEAVELPTQFNGASEVMGFLYQFFKKGNPGQADVWFNNRLNMIQASDFQGYSQLLFLGASFRYPNMKGILLEELSEPQKSDAHTVILYDQLIQLPIQAEEEINERIRYEQDYFEKMERNPEFLKMDIGARLCYVGELSFQENGYPPLYDGTAPWNKLLDKYIQHSTETDWREKHYFLKRIELFILYYLSTSNNIKENNPMLFERVKSFIEGIIEELRSRSLVPNQTQEYDKKVFDMAYKIQEYCQNP